MNRKEKLLTTLAAIMFGLLISIGMPAQAADNFTPTSDFTDNGDGTVTHKLTGLTWMRCAEGMSWSGATCNGLAAGYTFDQAIVLTSSYANKTDWRLPTIDELKTIVDRSYQPTINPTAFPNMPSSYFWSGSPYADYTYYAWYVNFNDGYAYSSFRYYGKHVRLVRGGQSSASLPVSSFALTVVVAGSGYGNVSSSLSGITCYNPVPGTSYLVAPDCSESLSSGTVVTLTATPVNGSTFSGWSGGSCTGTGACTVTMSEARSVTAQFNVTPATSQRVETFGYFNTEHAGANSVDFSGRSVGFLYFNDSGQGGVLEVYLPNASASASLEAFDKATTARLIKTSEICGLGAKSLPKGKCALYRLAAGQHATVSVTDSGYPLAEGSVQNPYPFLFNFYPDTFISVQDGIWREWAYQRAFLPWYDANVKAILAANAQIADDAAKVQMALAVAELGVSVATSPGAVKGLKDHISAANTAEDYLFGISGQSGLWVNLLQTSTDTYVSCMPPIGNPVSCKTNFFFNVANALNSAIALADVVKLKRGYNALEISRRVLDEQLNSGKDWLSDQEVKARSSVIAKEASANCSWSWFNGCDLDAYSESTVLDKYRATRRLMEGWIERAKWSAGYFPNRQQEFSDSERLFNCAERKYAELGAPAGGTDTANQYLFRHYPAPNLVIGTSNGQVYLYDFS